MNNVTEQMFEEDYDSYRMLVYSILLNQEVPVCSKCDDSWLICQCHDIAWEDGFAPTGTLTETGVPEVMLNNVVEGEARDVRALLATLVREKAPAELLQRTSRVLFHAALVCHLLSMGRSQMAFEGDSEAV